MKIDFTYIILRGEFVLYVKRANRYSLLLSISDILITAIVSVIAHFFTYGNISISELYSPTTIYLCGCIAISGNMARLYHKFVDRGYAKEFTNIVKQYFIEALFMILYGFERFVWKDVQFGAIFVILAVALTFGVRIGLKNLIKLYFSKKNHCRNLMIATTLDRVEKTVNHFLSNEDIDFNVFSLTVIDAPDNYIGKEIQGIKIAANMNNIAEYSVKAPIDEVYVNIGYHNSSMQKVIEMFEVMGATVHVELNCLNFGLPNARIEKISGTSVLTISNNIISSYQAVIKRLMDMVGGFIGCIITLLLCIFIVPAIKIADKGPAFFSQTRIGKNGRKFKMYKFRSMYMDAEERKKELMESDSNEMGSDMMFKMKNDPRIIPKIGNFIRNTSIDEFPQFFNVLKGDMSLVGTRPPTEDEFKKYSLHHKNRLSFKPGITGMWQVSGRSDITDFEEIVRLDSEYIANWSVGMDIKIIFKTIVNVIARKGAE